MLRRAICYDVTHLVTRLGISTPSGIDQVDLAYGRHFVERRLGPFIHYGLKKPHVLGEARGRDLLDLYRTPVWAGADRVDPAFERVRAALTGTPVPSDPHKAARWACGSRLRSAIGQVRFRLACDLPRVPEGAIYLNIAQHLLEYHFLFDWLADRPDIQGVFLIHDLLPLDYPEFFRPGYRARFAKRIATALRHGRAFIATSEVVRQRISAEISARRLAERPILVAPLPSSLPQIEPARLHEPDLAAFPYFVTVGTIEPRKNHLLLLNVWRHFVESGNVAPIPKLVLVGSRGWENEQVLDYLDRSPALRPHVLETRGLSPQSLQRLICNARALLMPSWAEGYGIPLVEALSVGTPVVATDASEFREVTQGRALFRSALDGVGWADAVRELMDPDSDRSLSARAAADRFVAPTWQRYFSAVEAFLADVSSAGLRGSL